MKIRYRFSKDKRSFYINKIIEENFPHMLVEKNPDLILLSGGDGAILHAIQETNYYKVPFFGFASGTLNFLMNEIEPDKIKNFIEKLEKDNIDINEVATTKISVEIFKKKLNKTIKIEEAVNDVVIGTTIMGYHTFLINSEEGAFKDFEIKGSGICISTDLGSTGYNFNLGGAVLPLGSNIWSIVGIVCNRYLDDILNIGKITIENTSKNNLLYNVFLDGIKHKINISKGDKLIIKKGDIVKIAFVNKKRFFEKRIDISSRFRKI